jgi:hypothetical protein
MMETSSSHYPQLLSLLLNILLALISYITFRILYQIIYYRSFHPLRHFPGPFLASVSRLWIAYHNIRGTECEVELALHRRYGPVLRITPTLLLVSDAEVYHRQASKSNHYITGSFGKTESLFNMQDHRVHARWRKVAAGPYAFSNVKRMEGLLDVRIVEWLGRIEELFCKGGKKFDFAPWCAPSNSPFEILSSVVPSPSFGSYRVLTSTLYTWPTTSSPRLASGPPLASSSLVLTSAV